MANLAEPKIGWAERIRLDRALVVKVDHDHASYSIAGHSTLSGGSSYIDGRWRFDF